MNVVAWVLTGLLAALYLAAGTLKLTQPQEKLLATGNMDWVEDFDGSQVKGIGAVEVAGAAGLVLPWALDIAPVLTPVAALGFAVLQGAALRTHLRRGDKPLLPLNAVLLVLALVVAVLRFSQL